MSADWHRPHPLNPQKRMLEQAVARVREGGVIVYPTDSCYALGCRLGDKAAADRVRAIRRFDRHHLFTVVCRSIAEIGKYARVDNGQFSILKSLAPGPYTFVLRASDETPRRVLHEKRKTFGMRVPDHRITQTLLSLLGEPLLSCTLTLPPDQLPVSDPEDAYARLHHLVDAVISAGNCGYLPTTVLDLTGTEPRLIRKGKGDVSRFFPEEAASAPV
jgi:tRNA threonylcarbamoyl adenosine modification protein (Sua5/YciO/YrdC/YwlC family)